MTFGFILKKIISAFLLPIASISLLILIGLFWIAFIEKGKKIGWVFVSAGLVLLIGLSSPFVANGLLEPLESPYRAAVNDKEAKAIVVLGSGHEDMNLPSPVHALSSTAFWRLSEGVRLAKQHPELPLIVSGYQSSFNDQPHALAMKNAAIMLGISEDRIISHAYAFDTQDELSLAKAYLGDDTPIYLVTSASHMTRALNWSRCVGVEAVPVATDFQVRQMSWWQLSAYTLYRSQMAMHEYIGTLWQQIKGC